MAEVNDLRFAIGVDIGGTKMIAMLGDQRGAILSEVSAETRAAGGSEAGVQRIITLIETAMARAGARPKDLAAIAAGSPGPLDVKNGLLLNPPNLGWGEVPLRQLLQDRFSVPIILTNDCKAAGYGEFLFGAGQGTGEMVYLGIGTGIGGCVILDGRVQYGATGNAGEIGHMVIAMDGPQCACGSRGCLEALASGSAIGRMGREAAAQEEGARILRHAGGEKTAVTGAHVAMAAAEGDPKAQAILSSATRALGIGVAGRSRRPADKEHHLGRSR